MSLPTAWDMFNEKMKGVLKPDSIEWYQRQYRLYLEQQNEKMRDALLYEYATTCETCKHDCTGRDGGCHQQKTMQAAIESATGLPIDEAIKIWETTK